jgi:hypothetical protein
MELICPIEPTTAFRALDATAPNLNANVESECTSASNLSAQFLFSQPITLVIIFGGCGFIGRHLVCYLRANSFVQRVAVIDKKSFQLTHLTKKELAVYEDDSFLTFLQADLLLTFHVDRVRTILSALMMGLPNGSGTCFHFFRVRSVLCSFLIFFSVVLILILLFDS